MSKFFVMQEQPDVFNSKREAEQFITDNNLGDYTVIAGRLINMDESKFSKSTSRVISNGDAVEIVETISDETEE
jgi:hypothetical protein